MKKYEIEFNKRLESCNNKDEIETILDIASKQVFKRFKVACDSKLLGVIYFTTVDAIVKEMYRLSKTHDKYQVSLCGRLLVSFGNGETDDELEKVGNITLTFKHNKYEKLDPKSELDDTVANDLARWEAANIIDNKSFAHKVAIDARDVLDKYGCVIIQDLIFPVFIAVYETAIEYIINSRHEKDELEYQINLLDTIIIKALEVIEEDADDITEILITPSVRYKQLMKDDKKASE